MKILHTSDWHLGKKLQDYDREEEQARVLDEIRTIAEEEEVDLVIIAGDLYDSFNPPTRATGLLYRTLKRLSNEGRRPVIAIGGNHDSPERIDAPDPLSSECGIFLAGSPNYIGGAVRLDTGLEARWPEPGVIILSRPDWDSPVRILATPYANETRLRACFGENSGDIALTDALRERWAGQADRYCDESGVNLLVTHLFMTGGNLELEEPDGERPILHPGGVDRVTYDAVPDSIQYTALGHLHRPVVLRTEPSPVVYSGSPLAYSLSEPDQQKRVYLVEAHPGNRVSMSSRDLNSGWPVLRGSFTDVESAVRWLSDNPECYAEVTLKTDTYLTVEEKQRIERAHPRLLALIPEVSGESSHEQRESVDLSRSMEELFHDFFKSRKGQDPSDEMMDLFREVLGQGGAE